MCGVSAAVSSEPTSSLLGVGSVQPFSHNASSLHVYSSLEVCQRCMLMIHAMLPKASCTAMWLSCFSSKASTRLVGRHCKYYTRLRCWISQSVLTGSPFHPLCWTVSRRFYNFSSYIPWLMFSGLCSYFSSQLASVILAGGCTWSTGHGISSLFSLS